MILFTKGILERITQGKWHDQLLRLIPWINSLFVLLLAYSLAGVSWRIWPQSDSVNALLPVSSAPSDSKDHRVQGLDAVASLHLFGESGTHNVALVQSVIDAPETRLSLTLKGIVAVSVGAHGRALIAEGSAVEKLYKVGDALSGGAVLHEVLVDKVILKRGGRFETLTLPRVRAVVSNTSQSSRGKASRGVNAPSARNPSAAISQQLRTLRDDIASDPQQAFNLVHAQPVMEGGKIKGYRVNPGKQRRLFQGTGLRAGDVVTSVNGIALGDAAKVATLFAQFGSANSFDLVVERGGQQTNLSIDLGK